MYKFGDTVNKYIYLGNIDCVSEARLAQSGYLLFKNPNGIVEVIYKDNTKNTEASILQLTTSFINRKPCCESFGYKFDIETQKCYWSDIPETKTDECTNCTTKVVYNTKGSDGTLFNVNAGETCDLTVSLDYILNFDCDLFTKSCSDNSELITEYQSTIDTLQTQIITKKAECEFITNELDNANKFFNSLCYVIKGSIPISDNNWVIDEGYVPWPRPYTYDDSNPWGMPPFAPYATSPTATAVDEPIPYNEIPNFLIPNELTPDIYTFGTIPPSPFISPNTFDNIMPLGPLYSSYDFKSDTIDGTSPPFAFSWSPEIWANDYIWDPQTVWGTPDQTFRPIPVITPMVPANYCLTERGLTLWESTLGSGRYSAYISKYGCDETTYTQSDFEMFYNSALVEITNNSLLSIVDFMIETTQQVCDKSVAFNDYTTLLTSSTNCKTVLNDLYNQLTIANDNLNAISSGNPSIDAIKNLENLKIFLNLEVEETNNVYKSIYEEQIFNIGTGNLLNYILNESPTTGILISGTTSGGILKSPFNFALNDYTVSCEEGRDEFMKQLYLTQYKGVYPDPTTPDEQLALNKEMNAWYNSSWLYYNKKIDSSITSQILNKKIKISLRIENCCLDLCILTDNLTLTKACESLHNEEIIISKSPEFEIERVMDNRKSWVSYAETTGREHDLQFRETQYSIDDYRLSINTKEIDLKIDGANAIEEDVLCIVDCLLSGTTGTTISGTCCPDKCDLGYITNFNDYSKKINRGKIDTTRNPYGYQIGYSIKAPSVKALDTYYMPVDTMDSNAAIYKSLNNQGIWVPIYPKTNLHIGCSNPEINEIEHISSCEQEDYEIFNRNIRDASFKAKNELLLATGPFDWANLHIPSFQIEKYYLNKPCSISSYNVGELAKGGAIGYVDETGQHGLVCRIVNASINMDKYWHVSDSGLVSATADGLYSGITNTNAIVSAYGSEANAAKFCSDYSISDTYTTYSDWYLPSKYELNIISQNWQNIGIYLGNSTTYTWSSTENDSSTAWAQNIFNGDQKIYNKSTVLNVIMVSKF